MLCGAVLPFVVESVPATLMVGTMAAAPLFAWLASRYPAPTLGLMVAAQPLAAFQFATPIGNPSPSIVLLALILITNAATVGSAYKARPLFRSTVWVLALWIASYALRIHYQDAGVVIRQMITLSSFVAVLIAAAALANERHVFLWTGAGVIFALSLLAVLGALPSIGVIASTAANAAPRDLLGLVSPFARSYRIAAAQRHPGRAISVGGIWHARGCPSQRQLLAPEIGQCVGIDERNPRRTLCIPEPLYARAARRGNRRGSLGHGRSLPKADGCRSADPVCWRCSIDSRRGSHLHNPA